MKVFKEINCLYRSYHTIPNINQFWSFNLSCNDAMCKSQKLLLKHGLIQVSSTGIYHFLPPMVKALEKLINIVDEEMKNIGGEKMIMPSLTPGRLWKFSGRWDKIGEELYKLKDRNDTEMCLGPTHEEAITELMSRHQAFLSHKLFPMKLYQITTKFRDEMRPRFGLLRTKEFIMKDMYTFDTSEEEAVETYNHVCKAYENIFKKLGILPVKVKGTFGNIGGRYTDEFHFLSDIGEDDLTFCKKILQMGCFGLGVSRVLGACLELLSTENELKWPLQIAPALVCVITPKAGGKEESAMQFAHDISFSLNQLEHLKDNVILDQRTKLTIGYRFNNAKEIGLPYIVIIGKKVQRLI
ncbi:probable proline--tRNA ligase, mitochondrial [Centruroides sculpturatus]|uniref:probable proline--tRNA ligase, mitochondrial n=1 Tax=Centruroides sculpturatus TaxID=218467 RepID=UPI000C6D127E|nr:probable proline--tRNA ligase, mitochondrial [Centruroides sculpturatus]